MKRFFVIVLIVGAVYMGTYIWLRKSCVERWDRDGHNYVMFPQSRLVYYVYRLLHMSTLISLACVFTSGHITSDYYASI